MISLDQVKAAIESELPGAIVIVEDMRGGDHLQAVVVSSEFEGKALVKQHQMVYKAVKQHLASEAIHALGLKTFTPAEWEAAGQVA